MKKTLVSLFTLVALAVGIQTTQAACPCSSPCQSVNSACSVATPCPIAEPCPACPIQSCNSCSDNGCNTGYACDNGCNSCDNGCNNCDCGCNNSCHKKCSWWKFWQNKKCCMKCDKCCDSCN